MSDPVEALILDLLEWIGPDSRPYTEVIEAWRTSCPRLPVWEEASERGLVAREYRDGIGAVISVSPAGHEFQSRHARCSDVYTARI
jgi:trans-aconitate 2-methyltransferase